MIDFRYHLVSIVAVFLALAIGIVLGSTELQGPVFNVLDRTTSQLHNQLTTEDPAGVTTTNTYSPTDMLTGVSYSGSAAHSVSYTYDANGQRTGMTDASGTSSYAYDPFGELTSEENGAGKTASYTYDLLGDQTSVTYPLGSGATWANSDSVTYDYDSAGDLTAVADFDGITTNVDKLSLLHAPFMLGLICGGAVT